MENEKTKLNFSDKELELVCNQDWILTKQIIIQKVYELFGNVSESMQQLILQFAKQLPFEMSSPSPKIVRGENYNGLPYVLLDYPRCFFHKDIFAVRTMFWWGNFFSVTMLLSGKYQNAATPKLMNNFTFLQQNGYWVCISKTPWEHHFEKSNYILAKDISQIDFEEMLLKNVFIKIAKKIPLEQWEAAPVFIVKVFEEMIAIVKD